MGKFLVEKTDAEVEIRDFCLGNQILHLENPMPCLEKGNPSLENPIFCLENQLFHVENWVFCLGKAFSIWEIERSLTERVGRVPSEQTLEVAYLVRCLSNHDMEKPTIFFSHSSKDKVPLNRLRELFLEKTSSTVDVFMSSDGQSIPLGRNWVHRVQQGLEAARIMVVFVTPNSLESNWIYFEAGYSNAKGIQVIPVGFLGVELGDLRPPLALLQGFNISNADGLNNLIAVVNKEFTFTHRESFSDSEFQSLMDLAQSVGGLMSHRLPEGIEDITLSVRIPAPELFDAIFIELQGLDIPAVRNKHCISFAGVRIARTVKMPGSIKEYGTDIYISPFCFEKHLSVLRGILDSLSGSGFENRWIRFRFPADYEVITEDHRISGLLDGLGLEYSGEGRIGFRGLSFRVGKERVHHEYEDGSSEDVIGPAYAEVYSESGTLSFGDLRMVLNGLVDNKVIRPPSRLVPLID